MILLATVVAKTSECKGDYFSQRFLSGARIGLVANEATSYPVCPFSEHLKMRYMHGWERNERAQSTRTGLYGDLKGRYGSRAAPKSRGLFESVFCWVF
jgi:hypothetical protein